MKKYIRFLYQNETHFGVVDNDTVSLLDRDFLYPNTKPTGETCSIKDVQLLPPVTPPNVLAVGINYKPHASELVMKLPDHPLIFLKATTSVIGPGDAIILPGQAPDEVDFEAELCIVIGKKAHNVSEEDAPDYIFGYTCANDVSARDCQWRLDTQWARGKSFDTFCPIGPCVVPGLDGDNLKIRSILNGQVMQDSTTSLLIANTRRLVSFCSHAMTLLPGTIILTGTPAGVGFKRTPPIFLREGDTIDVEIENIGTLSNPVLREKDA